MLYTSDDILYHLIYRSDASCLENNTSFLVEIPNTIDELKTIVAEAVKNGQHILTRGAGTNLVGSCIPAEDTLVLDCGQLDQIGTIDVDNKTITVQTALTTDNLNAYLEPYQLFFPVIIGTHTVAQLGAMTSTNGAGMKAIRYGKMNNRVEAIRVLMVDQEKNLVDQRLTGQEIQNFCGSEGQLGIILELKLLLTRKEEQGSISFLPFDSVHELLEELKKIHHNAQKHQLFALEFIDKQVSVSLGLEGRYHLLVEYQNASIGETHDPQKIAEIWNLRDACYPIVASKGYVSIEDPQVPMDQLPALIDRLESHDIPTFGHIGIGILHPHFKADQEALKKELYALVASLGGKVSGEHGIGLKKQAYLSAEELETFKKLKNYYDPHNFFGY